jgi:uncharacterized lipoprotein YddW (UPF0748 family)
MKNLNRIICMGVLLCAGLALAAPMKEYRGVWVEFTDRSWGKTDEKELVQLVDDLSQNNFNAISPLTRDYSGGMLYASNLSTPVQPHILPGLVKEAHKRGMQVHAWMPCLIAGFLKPDPVLLQHPDWGIVYKDGKNCLDRPVDKVYWWYDPSNPGVREHMKGLAKEIAAEGVDGINLDWLRTNPEWTYSETFRKGFEAKYGFDPIDCKTPAQEKLWHDYRVGIITSLAKEIRDAAKSVNPKIKISAAVAPDPAECRESRLQDWQEWTKFLDFIFPMIYRAPDKSITTDAKKLIKIAHCPVYIGLGGDETLKAPAADYNKMIQQVRRSGAKGFSFYRYDQPDRSIYMNLDDLVWLRVNSLKNKAVIP